MQQIAESIVRVSHKVMLRRLNTPQLAPILQEAKHNRPAILRFNRRDLSHLTAELNDYVYLVVFDPMICLEDQWVDGETLSYFNSLRTNILVSSTQFDAIQLTDQHNRLNQRR
jgi:hypothetical protein